MGIPLYKPKETKDESRRKSPQPVEDMESDEFWSLFPQQFIQTVHNRHSNRRSSIRPTISSYHIAPISSSSPFHRTTTDTNLTSLPSRIRSRLSRRHSMLTSSLMDRRRSSRVHSIHASSPASSSSSNSSWQALANSPPIRSELDRRLFRRISEKEELLEQLRVMVSLLDQFLEARGSLRADMRRELPSFLTEDLPTVLASATSLAAMTTSALTSSSSGTNSSDNNNEVLTVQQLVERFLRIPPYSTRIYHIENSIVIAHRRIREQLSQLGSEVMLPSPPSPQLPSSTSDSNPSITIEHVLHANSRSSTASPLSEPLPDFYD